MQRFRQKNIVFLILLVGVCLRLGEYFSNPSFTSDEALTAIRLESISLKDAFFLRNASFENMQSYPIVFLTALKLSKSFFGSNELSLRLFPLVTSLLSLFLFYFVASFFLNDGWLHLAALLFAVSRDLVFMSAYLKPFASDIFVALMMYAIFICIHRHDSTRLKTLIFAICGVLAVFLSLPASIFVFSVSFPLAAFYHYQNRREKAQVLYRLIAVWLIALSAYYYFSLQYITKDPQLKTFWASSFFPVTQGPVAMGQWLMVVFKRILGKFLQYPIGLSALFFVLGVIAVWGKDKVRGVLLAVPILATIILSAFQLYPFDGRTIYFLFPCVIILTVFGASVLVSGLLDQKKTVSMLVTVFMLFMPVLASAQQLLESKGSEEVRPLLYYIKEHTSEKDIVLVYRGAQHAYQFYTDQLGLKVHSHTVDRRNIREVLKELTRQKKKQRVWILFTHVKFDYRLNERLFLLDQLESFGQKSDELVLTVRPMSVIATLENNISAALYLYELENKG